MNGKAPVETLFNKMVRSKTLSKRHKFDEVQPTLGLRKGLAGVLPHAAFHPPAPTTSMPDPLPYIDVVGSSNVTPWWKCPPDESGKVFADVHLFRMTEEHVDREAVWNAMGNLWMTCLLTSKQLVRRTEPWLDADAPDRWYFVMGCKFDSANPLYPAEQLALPGEPDVFYYLPAKLHKRVYAAVLDLDVWESMTYEWRCPLWAWYTYPNSRKHESLRCIGAFPTCKPGLIIQVTAGDGFHDIGVTALKKFVKYLWIEVDPSQINSLFWLLLALILDILDCDMATALAIIARRIGAMRSLTVTADGLLDVDDGLELVDVNDRNVINQEKNALNSDIDEFNGLLEQYRLALTRAQPAAERSSHVVQEPLPDAILQKDAKKYAPPGATIWKCSRTKGWAGHYPPLKRCSAPQHKYGDERACLVQMLKMLWHQHLWMLSLPKSACPIRGLLSDDGDVTLEVPSLPAEPPGESAASSSSSGPPAAKAKAVAKVVGAPSAKAVPKAPVAPAAKAKISSTVVAKLAAKVVAMPAAKVAATPAAKVAATPDACSGRKRKK